MIVRVNGTDSEVEAGATLAGLLAALGIDAARTVAEVNGSVVERGRFGEVALAPGDRVELVRFVGGG